MHSWIRIVAVACALIVVTLAFQTLGAQAHTPNTGVNEPTMRAMRVPP